MLTGNIKMEMGIICLIVMILLILVGAVASSFSPVTKKLVDVAIIILISVLLLPLLLGSILGVDIFSSFGLSFFIAIIMAGVLLGISGFAPYDWGKALRQVSYVGLFIAILIFFLGVLKPLASYIEESQLKLGSCTNVVFPQLDETKWESNLHIVLGYVSCVLTGKFLQEGGLIESSSFFLFYLLFPAIFVYKLLEGIMQGVNLAAIFGGNENATRTVKILSMILSMYALRTLMGAFVIQFATYGIFGLFPLLFSILIVLAVKKMVDGWLPIGQYVANVREAMRMNIMNIMNEIKYAESILPRVNEVRQYAERERRGTDERRRNQALTLAKNMLKSYVLDEYYLSLLGSATKKAVENIVREAENATNFADFLQKVELLKSFLENKKNIQTQT